jgi:hypothetical protein
MKGDHKISSRRMGVTKYLSKKGVWDDVGERSSPTSSHPSPSQTPIYGFYFIDKPQVDQIDRIVYKDAFPLDFVPVIGSVRALQPSGNGDVL